MRARGEQATATWCHAGGNRSAWIRAISLAGSLPPCAYEYRNPDREVPRRKIPEACNRSMQVTMATGETTLTAGRLTLSHRLAGPAVFLPFWNHHVLLSFGYLLCRKP